MQTPEVRELNLDHEIDKLKKMYLLPITNVVYDKPYEYGKTFFDAQMDYVEFDARLYVNDDFIGTIPYIMTGKWGPGYLQFDYKSLAWDKIVAQYRQQFIIEILKQQPLVSFVEAKEFRSLNVMDKDGNMLNIAYCTYLSNEWNIVLGDLNEERKIKTRTVTLTPPPPFNS